MATTGPKNKPKPCPDDPTLWTHWHDHLGREIHVVSVVAVAVTFYSAPQTRLLRVEKIHRLNPDGDPYTEAEHPLYIYRPSASITGVWLDQDRKRTRLNRPNRMIVMDGVEL